MAGSMTRTDSARFLQRYVWGWWYRGQATLVNLDLEAESAEKESRRMSGRPKSSRTATHPPLPVRSVLNLEQGQPTWSEEALLALAITAWYEPAGFVWSFPERRIEKLQLPSAASGMAGVPIEKNRRPLCQFQRHDSPGQSPEIVASSPFPTWSSCCLHHRRRQDQDWGAGGGGGAVCSPDREQN
ncbi:uncharacterized protein LY79DRAFT_581785 [Colletotrichum navitas]|uniref:Uncharacterized protein n=1 Tax=Colletotrichum navitas TaxID=681940 RepID=A0AAD8PUM1_9PEZI|nr:uncharacterized protein LY79DRAFT_581785 [Colletotrichum navitas]KAK1580542.1 hypothetical protein LY79DRAFT_581785 [Colletotrichum navitas]